MTCNIHQCGNHSGMTPADQARQLFQQEAMLSTRLASIRVLLRAAENAASFDLGYQVPLRGVALQMALEQAERSVAA